VPKGHKKQRSFVVFPSISPLEFVFRSNLQPRFHSSCGPNSPKIGVFHFSLSQVFLSEFFVSEYEARISLLMRRKVTKKKGLSSSLSLSIALIFSCVCFPCLEISLHKKEMLFLDGYCSTVQGLLDWFEVDLGFTEISFIQIDLCVLCVFPV